MLRIKNKQKLTSPPPASPPGLKMDRIQLINLFITKRGYKRYLEIGCFEDHCFRQINAEVKVGVDPVSGGTVRATSDEFFKGAIERQEKFDIIFIDGLHHHDQVYRDVENSLACLADGGAILMHDCLPPDRNHETAASGEIQLCGTVWRAFVKFRERPDLDAIVADCDYGVGLIRKVPNPLPLAPTKPMDALTYDDFVAHRAEWMRPVHPTVFAIVADRPWHPLQIAVLVIGKNDEDIATFKAKNPHVENEARMVYVSNPGRKLGGTAAIANPFLDAATEDVVGVVHADTVFGEGSLRVFARAAVDHNAVVGIVGRKQPDPDQPFSGYVWCSEGGGYVSTLDSCSLFFRRSLGFRYDGATFDDFHCVSEDICLQAASRGIPSFVPSANASHLGGGGNADWDQQFWAYRAKLVQKYPGITFHTI